MLLVAVAALQLLTSSAVIALPYILYLFLETPKIFSVMELFSMEMQGLHENVVLSCKKTEFQFHDRPASNVLNEVF